MCFSNWVICPSCVWVANSDSKRTNKKFWKNSDCWKCKSKDSVCFITPTDGIQLGICVDCLKWAADVLSKSSQPQNQTMPTLEESLLKCKVDGCVVYLPPMSEGPLENYQEVRKALMNAGAKYKRNTFVFPNEAQLYIDRLVSGESVNIKKEFQFFATPNDIAATMVSYLPPVAADAKVLEPSAGDGALIIAFLNAYPEKHVDCFEIMDINCRRLNALIGARLIGEDFMQNGLPDNSYDIIIANPPFTKNQDINHIMEMYRLLKPGGTIITLASPSWTFGTQKKQVEFKKWLERHDVFPKTLPEKSFASSGTNITPVLLQIQKPVEIVGASGGVTGPALSEVEARVETNEYRKPAEILEDIKATNKEIDQHVEQLQEMINDDKPVRKCRVCGCTDDNCSQCIEKTGEPCHWVEDDLCSACQKGEITPIAETEQELETQEKGEDTPKALSVPDAYQEYLDNRNSSSITFTEMKFFEQLKLTGKDIHLSIDIKEKNGKYTVMILPKASDASRIMPIVVTGTPDELDEDFFKKVGPQLIQTGLQLQGIEEHRKSVEEAAKSNVKKSTPVSSSSASNKPEKKGPAAAAAKKNAGKKIEKKGAAKKQVAKKETKKEETKKEESKVVEQALF
jgi:PRTRC genetic system protein E